MALLAGVSKPQLLSGRTTPPECRGIAGIFPASGFGSASVARDEPRP